MKASNINRLLIVLALGNTASLLPCAGQQASVTLQKEFSGQRVPSYQNGYFVAIDRDENQLARFAYLFGSDGAVRLRLPVRLEGFAETTIGAVGARSDGGMVVSAGGTGPDGVRRFHLLWYEPDGRLQCTAETTPFAATHLYAQGETLWAAGREIEADKLKKGHHILRRYGSCGQLTGSFLNWESFPPPAAIKGHPDADAHLFGGAGAVAFLSVTAMEIALVGGEGTVQRYPLPALEPGARITGASFTPEATVVISVQRRQQGQAEARLYEWRPGAPSWQPLPSPAPTGAEWAGLVLGADPQGIWLSGPDRRAFRYTR